MKRILESISRRTLAVGALCLLLSAAFVLPGCGEEEANEALRELVGRWQLDVGESLKRSLSGLIDTGFDPSVLGSQEIERMEREKLA